MGYGSGWPEPQPEYSDPLHHYQHQYSAPPSLHHHQSYFHHPPNPNPLPTCDPPASSAVPPPADPYAPHTGYAYPHPQAGPTPPSYNYGGAASGAGGGGGGGGVEPQGFSVKDAIRQYGADPVSYADPPMSGYADSIVGFSDTTVGYAQAPPRPSHGLAALLQAPPLKPNWKGQSYLGGWKKESRKTTKVVQSAYCEVCKVDCTSQEVLNGHRQGKKHKKNLQKLQESITPKPMKAPSSAAKPAGAKESQVASKGKAAVTDEKRKRKEAPAATEEDLETKKKKMLEGGAAPDGVRVCTICNVVVNSQKVYDSHISGQKHITTVKQQQEKAAAS